MENYPLRKTIYAKKINQHLENTIDSIRLRGVNVSKAYLSATLIQADDYLAFDSKYAFTVRILNETDENGQVPMWQDSIELPERNGNAFGYMVIDNIKYYIDQIPISEMDNLRKIVKARGGTLLNLNDKSLNIDWLEEAEFVSYKEFCNEEFESRTVRG